MDGLKELNEQFKKYINTTPFNILNIDLSKPITEKIFKNFPLGNFQEEIYSNGKWYPYITGYKICYTNGEPDEKTGIKYARFTVDSYVFLYQKIDKEYELIYHFPISTVDETNLISSGRYYFTVKEIMDAFDADHSKGHMVIDNPVEDMPDEIPLNDD